MTCRGDVKPETIQAVAEALQRHTLTVDDRPTVVSNSELVRRYGAALGFSRREISCLGRSTIARSDLYKALGGRARWGSAPTYDRGKWAL